MLPSSLFSAYRQYKQDTDAVASWLAATARAHGYPAELLTNKDTDSPPSQQPKSGRLKGKARKQAQQKAAKSDQPAAVAPKYTVAIKDFIPLAE
jgi:hypothetical protein